VGVEVEVEVDLWFSQRWISDQEDVDGVGMYIA
jgi:hypothetical protein